MELRCEELTRGSGKIFLRIAWDGLGSSSCRVDVRCASRTGKALPVATVPLPGEPACVVILAIFRKTQKLEVSLRNEQGDTLGTLHKTINATAARLTSQINTLRHNQAAEAIRNIDIDHRREGIYVKYGIAIYRDSDGNDVLHGTAIVLGERREDVCGKLTLRFYDSGADLIGDGSWIPMGDSCSQSKEYPGFYCRTVGFSVTMPHEIATLACWAYIDTKSPGMWSTVECLRTFEIRAKRQYWEDLSESSQETPSYDNWFRTRHRTPEFELRAQRERRFGHEPMFSIVVPVFRTPVDFFREMVNSVLAQTYSNFELILVNASTSDVALSNEIEEYASKDKRVRVLRLAGNLGIVGNTYAGVDVATGDFISFFDHDDVLEPDVLFRYVEGINEYPTTDLLYCDEDKLLDGSYISPFFKPDWSPDLLCSENYVCHLLTVRKSIVDNLPREGLSAFEGSQDHHLTLFAGERARNVYHARKVLYHWRMHEQSTAAGADSKTYTTEAGVRAVQAHMDRCGIAATARPSGIAPNTYHVDYVLKQHPLVSIIIPNKDMTQVLDRCIRSICERSSYQHFEIVIVENNSAEAETFAYYDELRTQDERIRVVHQPTDGTFNFSKTINFGVSHSTGEYLLLLNNDTEVLAPNWIERMLGPAMRGDVGAVGAKLLYPDGLIQHVGVLFHKGTGPFHVAAYMPEDSLHYYCSPQLTTNYSAVTGACLLTRRDVFDTVGGFDERLAVDYNDVDFCLRIREEGLFVVYEPEAKLMHYESISRGGHRSVGQKREWCANMSFMMNRWPRYFVEGDPFCNPNLAFSAYHQLEDPHRRGAGHTFSF